MDRLSLLRYWGDGSLGDAGLFRTPEHFPPPRPAARRARPTPGPRAHERTEFKRPAQRLDPAEPLHVGVAPQRQVGVRRLPQMGASISGAGCENRGGAAEPRPQGELSALHPAPTGPWHQASGGTSSTRVGYTPVLVSIIGAKGLSALQLLLSQLENVVPQDARIATAQSTRIYTHDQATSPDPKGRRSSMNQSDSPNSDDRPPHAPRHRLNEPRSSSPRRSPGQDCTFGRDSTRAHTTDLPISPIYMTTFKNPWIPLVTRSANYREQSQICLRRQLWPDSRSGGRLKP